MPESWGRYRLTEKVGEGSFGSVYRAWDPDLQREIAIKILHSRVADAHLKERLLSEGRALAKVRHPNVVSVFGVEAHGDRVGLCMEFVHGATLESELAGARHARRARDATARRRGGVSRPVGRARRRVRASRRQGQKRHARGGRTDRPDGLRHRTRSRGAEGGQLASAWRARRCTWRRRCWPDCRPRNRATCTASACCCITSSRLRIRSKAARSTSCAPPTCRASGVRRASTAPGFRGRSFACSIGRWPPTRSGGIRPPTRWARRSADCRRRPGCSGPCVSC